jgi:hypothetical protein
MKKPIDKTRKEKLVKGYEGQKTSLTRVFNGTVVKGKKVKPNAK